MTYIYLCTNGILYTKPLFTSHILKGFVTQTWMNLLTLNIRVLQEHFEAHFHRAILVVVTK